MARPDAPGWHSFLRVLTGWVAQLAAFWLAGVTLAGLQLAALHYFAPLDALMLAALTSALTVWLSERVNDFLPLTSYGNWIHGLGLVAHQALLWLIMATG